MLSNKLNLPIGIFVIAFTLCVEWGFGQNMLVESVGATKTWIDPTLNPASDLQSIVVWFDVQFLGKSDSFLKRVKEFDGQKLKSE